MQNQKQKHWFRYNDLNEAISARMGGIVPVRSLSAAELLVRDEEFSVVKTNKQPNKNDFIQMVQIMK
jgi:hypothetical protein